AVASVNRKRRRDRHWRERTERPGNHEVTERRVNTAFCPLAGNEAETDRKETIASQRRVRDGRRGCFATPSDQQVGKVTRVLEPEIFFQRRFGAGRQRGPSLAVACRADPFELAQQ